MGVIRTLDDVDVAGKRVLVRVDLNLPVHEGQITDTMRIDRLAPTVRELAAKNARIVLISHFGRPSGYSFKESLARLAPAVSTQFGLPVAFAEDCIGPVAEKAANALADGEILLLENLRFHKGEEKNDPAFVAALAKLGDIYIDDAFSCAHRAHASIAGIAGALPAFAGRGMEAELKALDRALGNPIHPVAAIVGGSKVSTKLDLLRNLVGKVDLLVLGGGMANTFLAARGVKVGKSLAEMDMLDTAHAIEAEAAKRGCTILLPVDGVVAEKFGPGQAVQTVSIDQVPDDRMVLDIGPASIAAICARLQSCKTIVWNGPMGAFEVPPFDRGTVAVAQAVAKLTRDGAVVSIGGGGDTVAALAGAGVSTDFTYISTAGGAFLEWMEGKILPGVVPLMSA
jgi:phosphoglycerate kinase